MRLTYFYPFSSSNTNTVRLSICVKVFCDQKLVHIARRILNLVLLINSIVMFSNFEEKILSSKYFRFYKIIIFVPKSSSDWKSKFRGKIRELDPFSLVEDKHLAKKLCVLFTFHFILAKGEFCFRCENLRRKNML